MRSIVLAVATLLLMPLFAIAANPCGECHEQAVSALAAGPHGAAVQRDAAMCAACHGDPKLHLQSGSADDIRKGVEVLAWSSERQAEACAGCHRAEFPGWRRAAHVSEGLCWSCHENEALHRPPPAATSQKGERASYELCVSCHRGVATQLRAHYKHGSERGDVTCGSCHDIHGRSLSSIQTVSDATCLTCHEEQRGPFLFTHGALENGCASCHAAHGSPHRGQLKTAGNGICVSCHLQTNFPTVGGVSHDFRLNGGGRCWDCHSDVHGSNTTPDLNPRGRR